ncbi:MAG: hypothetical protein AAFY48_24525, partial [Bacteroidota bacterium]
MGVTNAILAGQVEGFQGVLIVFRSKSEETTIRNLCLLQRPSESWLETDAFLLKDYTIRYAYYADLLLAEQEEVSDGRFLGFGTEYDK